jgi:hypothetical protein
VAKVNKGVGQLAGVLTEILTIDKDTYVEQITLDVFGFSRGAAAARHFVSLLRNERPLAARLGAPRAKVVIKFVGVFDTVSSYGVGLSFGSSVAELGLALGGVPQKVVHLTAGDECRENFSLTDISSSLGSGYELTLPGVHSDVGGGYGEVEDETRTFSTGERARLLGQGWYTPAQLRDSTIVLPVTSPYVSPATVPCLVGTRRALRWHYQFIPLRLMATYAQAHGVSWQPLRPGSRFGKYALSPGHELLPVQAAIEAAAAGHGGAGGTRSPSSSSRSGPRWPTACATPTCTSRSATASAWAPTSSRASPAAGCSPASGPRLSSLPLCLLLPLLSTLCRCAVLGLLSALAACGQSSPSSSSSSRSMHTYQTEKFLLTAGPCAADGYWVTIQSGVFIGSDGKAFSVPSGHTLEGNWGTSGTVWSSGDDRHPAPARLSLTWFAYAEDKFYQGEFLLPQERIYQLLKQARGIFPNRNR